MNVNAILLYLVCLNKIRFMTLLLGSLKTKLKSLTYYELLHQLWLVSMLNPLG
nr:unnamed protein product [Callosobruchus chinensis]